MVISVASSDDLQGAREAGSERVLDSHVKQARRLEFPRPRLRADVDGVETAVAGQRGDLGLGLLVVARYEHVEGLAVDLALSQGACEGRVEGLYESRVRGEAGEFVGC